GYHRFDVTWEDERTVVKSEARFAVKILFLNAYQYSHDNTEYWAGNCLTRIDAQTDDNGKPSVVSGSAEDGGFRVSTGDKSSTLSGCVSSFAYWNPAFLEADKLLNSQTGDYTPVTVVDSSDDVVTINGTDIPARRVTLSAGERPIMLWYRADDGAWLQLATTAAKDRELRYTLDVAPDSNALPARRLAAALDAVQ
ncbi:MAG: hypothetical protein HKO62_10075, partial [Gammaproteobacteria bacterium]|nr:hypothetical protein [Gammaproteobacteria bacterium]